VTERYGDVFREAYALLHGGRAEEMAGATERDAGESLEVYLARTRSQALGTIRGRLLAQHRPALLAEAHRLLLALLAKALEAEVALAEQVHSYQCGQFRASVRHSDRLQQIVTESQRLDRQLILALKRLPAHAAEELGLEV
jgi:hypothetical protein